MKTTQSLPGIPSIRLYLNLFPFAFYLFPFAFLLLPFSFCLLPLQAQAPQKMSYQAVIRNAGGQLVTGQQVGMKISILKGEPSGTAVFIEIYNPNPVTNSNGLVTVEIGGGIALQGSFSNIDWSDGPYFIKTETDPSGGTNYTITGISRLLSVPYALYAASAGTTGSLLWEDGEGKVTTGAKVGIGTDNPQVDLEIRSAQPNYWAMMTIGNSDLSHAVSIYPGREGDPNPFIQWKDGDPLRFSTDQGGWSEKMRITSDGKVGIGISEPAEKLEVDGNIDLHSHHIINVADPVSAQDAATKAYVDDILDSKVDKVEGKGLSAEDYTTAEKTKLAGIAEGAQVNIQSDWNQPTTDADDFIKNKPDLTAYATKDMANQSITNLATPVNAQDAATKAYVDELKIMILDFKAQIGVTDERDGTHYKAVRINNQIWMSENLRYLPSVAGSGTGSQTTPYYYVYGYNGTVVADAKATSNYTAYGVLYNWPAAMNGATSSTANPSGVQGVCPTGWHLPSDAEWTELENYLIANAYNYDGTTTENKIAKSLATSSGWASSSEIGSVGNTDYPEKRNATGFSALPGGRRLSAFGLAERNGYWWSATGSGGYNNAWYRYLDYRGIGVYRDNVSKDYGFSVRCLRDN